MKRTNRAGLKIVAVAAGVAALAGCQTPPPPPPPPPPPLPPVQAEIIPPRPIPPNGAAYIMAIPPLGADGVRQTVNTGLSADERAWNFRAAWNVAALNCLDAEYQPILDGYRAMLKNHAKSLTALNSRIDQAYRKAHGSSRGRSVRDKQMTVVYNFFALPPARGEFCQAAVTMAQASLASPKSDLLQFAGVYFPLLEQPFENFFLAYEDYQRRSADWDARYGARYGASQPGYVAVQQSRANSLVDAGGGNPALTTLQAIDGGGTTLDPLTGLPVPVLPVNPGQESTPVVQPLPDSRSPGR